MRLDLYQKETAHLAAQQSALLDEVADRMKVGESLSALEQNGVLHALQLVIENAIGKAKHILKHLEQPVPTSAYDAMSALVRTGHLPAAELDEWNAVIGLRNRIVHDYMNLDMALVLDWVADRRYQRVVDFLKAPIDFSQV